MIAVFSSVRFVRHFRKIITSDRMCAMSGVGTISNMCHHR